MEKIAELFDKFATAYQHSLYAIEKEKNEVTQKRTDNRESIKEQYAKARCVSINSSASNLAQALRELDETCSCFTQDKDTIIRAAEYLTYGKVRIENLKKFISETSIPCIIPFIGHGNVMLESNGEECHALGVQFALQALLQTAPGQLSLTVINPNLRPEFSAFTRLSEFQMLVKSDEIANFFTNIIEELVEVDTLLQGRYTSLVELRRIAQQPVGKLRVIAIQDLPSTLENNLQIQLIKLLKSAPRAGIAILFLSSKNATKNNTLVQSVTSINNFTQFKFTENRWYAATPANEMFSYDFPIQTSDVIAESVSELIEKAKHTSVVTIPFNLIKDSEKMWTESSTENIIFNLGKSGLDTVSVCIGDNVNQHHNILISGAVGKGKSNLLEVMIHSLCWRYSPQELELYLLDFKDGLTFKPYSDNENKSWLPHAKMLGLESARDVGVAILKDLENERLHRAEVFRSAPNGGAKGYEEYRKNFPHEKIPRIVLVIDEYQKLFETNDDISEEAAALLENLVRQGRACAIHIVLASQSINGAAGLLGKDEKIYAQFPIRIALQNTVSESHALFGIGNDAAAQLRVRGEAIINKNYGALDSNQKFTVAYADPKETFKIRQAFCLDERYGKLYPVIFSRYDYMNFPAVISEVKRWRNAVIDTGVIHAPIGVKLSVKKDVISLPFTNDMGKNIAILGSAENLLEENAKPGEKNAAIGMAQGICLSLALQHPEGNARFVLIDGLPPDIYRNSNMDRWSQLMERFGFPIECVKATEAGNWLSDFLTRLKDYTPDEDTYILCLGMDRYTGFSDINLCGESGTDAFQKLLKLGTKGVHFICWWSNVSTYKNHLGFSNEGYFATKVLLRMDADTSREVLGPFVKWGIRENRAYIHDNSELPSDETLIPLMPESNRICGIIESENW